MQRASKILSAARKWVGTPYVHQRREIGIGVDCIQFVIAVGVEVGAVKNIGIDKYRLLNSPTKIREYLEQYGEKLEKPKLGCVVYWGSRINLPTHFGILSELHEKPAIIHADYEVGKVVEHNIPEENMVLIDSYWWFK